MAASSDDGAVAGTGAVSLPSFSSAYKGVASILNPPLQTVIAAFSTTKHVTTGLPTPSHVNIELMGGEVYKLLTTIFEQNLLLLHYIQVTLREWTTPDKKDTSHPVVHFLDVEPSAFDPADFRVYGIYETHHGITLSAQASRNLLLLTRLRYPMSAFISKLLVTMNLHKASNFKKVRLLADIHACYEALVPSLLQVARSSEANIQFRATDLPPYSDPEDAYVTAACFKILENQHNLDDFIRSLVSRHRKPRNNPNHWIWFGVGAVSIAVCSIWIYRSGICSTLLEGIKGFGSDLHQSLATFRDDCISVKEKSEFSNVESSTQTLHRMLLNFFERTTGEKPLPDMTDEDLMAIVNDSYEKEVLHPLKSLVTGRLIDSLMIQIEKFKVEFEWGKYKLNEMIRANSFNLAIIPVLPHIALMGLTLFCSIAVSWKLDDTLKCKQKHARAEATQVLTEVEQRLLQLTRQTHNERQDDGFQYFNGLVLYTLDRLYRGLQSYALESREWVRLRAKITFLRDSYELDANYIKNVVSQLSRFDCLQAVPSSDP